MKITILTPTRDRRRQNWSALWERIQSQGTRTVVGPSGNEIYVCHGAGDYTGLNWHIIQSPEDSDSGRRIFTEAGVTFHHPPSLPGHADSYEKWNWFVDNEVKGEPGSYIHMLADDDLIPADFYYNFLNGERGPVTITSMYRGQNTVGFHENTPLIAQPENMVCGKIGMEQFIFEEDFAKSCIRFDTRDGFEDGKMGERLALEFPKSVVYRPDLAVYFNAMEVGRWNVVP